MIMPMPGRSFQIAGVLALTGIIAAMVSGMRGEPAPSPTVTAAVAKPVFAERFEVPDDFPMLRKTDRLPLPNVITGEPTQTVATARPDQVEKPTEKKPVEKPHGRTMTAEREVEHDVCARHHMHKVITHGGRSWRCRR